MTLFVGYYDESNSKTIFVLRRLLRIVIWKCFHYHNNDVSIFFLLLVSLFPLSSRAIKFHVATHTYILEMVKINFPKNTEEITWTVSRLVTIILFLLLLFEGFVEMWCNERRRFWKIDILWINLFWTVLINVSIN